ncbi:hypothetical protein GLIP_0353 [Aliiglaciecola lipolytica E3]|uniref:Uncharacterized protein n=1 Tax=Aliiglaciecola lipolytica E3 TaxID=1127673 RepID=K6YNS5_9ALTE|nr:hypothetical protein GLIP_0353 [Aliiglaciecola lipolytica E3]
MLCGANRSALISIGLTLSSLSRTTKMCFINIPLFNMNGRHLKRHLICL